MLGVGDSVPVPLRKSKMVEGGMKCVKYLIFFFNFIFVVSFDDGPKRLRMAMARTLAALSLSPIALRLSCPRFQTR